MAGIALRQSMDAQPAAVTVWTSGDADHPFFEACRADSINCIEQTDGDLGARMADCLNTMLASYQAVLLIGSDCPAMTSAHLQQAADALLNSPQAALIFTPAEDGGYVLVGAQRDQDGVLDSAAFQAFENIEWSSSRVMAQTRQRLAALGWQQGVQWLEMPPLWDVDTTDDYQRAVEAGLLPEE